MGHFYETEKCSKNLLLENKLEGGKELVTSCLGITMVLTKFICLKFLNIKYFDI